MRGYALAIALTAWSALLLQLPLSIAVSRKQGMTTLGAVVTYLSFFTILTNLLVAAGLTCFVLIPRSKPGRFFSRTSVLSGMALFIAMVGAVYSLVLRYTWNPEGLQKIVDIALHDVVPVAYLVFWVLFAPKVRLPYSTIGLWLLYPLLYLCYSLLRGALTGWYPYPFLAANVIGYNRVLQNVAILVVAFSGLGYLMAAITRMLSRTPLNPNTSVT